MDFALPAPLRELQQQTRRFIADRVVPMEGDPRQSPHGPSDALRRELVAKGREAGLRYARAYVEEQKASGFVARGLQSSGQHDATVAPAAAN